MISVSTIVPCYNSEITIGRCIEALLKQNYPKKDYEIIVVDDGSTDRSKEIVSRFRKVKLIAVKHGGPARARNIGAKVARGKILLFTDADCIPNKNWIKKMTKHFKDKEIVGVSGTYETLNKDSLIARFAGYEIEERHKLFQKERFIDFIGTFSAAYRKDIFSKFGGFDTSFLTSSGEDTEFSFKISKAGYKMIYEPKAVVKHKHPNTLWKFLKQKFWRGYWRILVYKKHKDKMFKHSYTPKYLYWEEALIGLTLLMIVFSSIGLVPSYISLTILVITILLTLPLSFKIFKKDKIVGISSPIIILLRNIFTGFGIVYGLLENLIKRF